MDQKLTCGARSNLLRFMPITEIAIGFVRAAGAFKKFEKARNRWRLDEAAKLDRISTRSLRPGSRKCELGRGGRKRTRMRKGRWQRSRKRHVYGRWKRTRTLRRRR